MLYQERVSKSISLEKLSQKYTLNPKYYMQLKKENLE